VYNHQVEPWGWRSRAPGWRLKAFFVGLGQAITFPTLSAMGECFGWILTVAGCFTISAGSLAASAGRLEAKRKSNAQNRNIIIDHQSNTGS
jgi:hypothetical protein